MERGAWRGVGLPEKVGKGWRKAGEGLAKEGATLQFQKCPFRRAGL